MLGFYVSESLINLTNLSDLSVGLMFNNSKQYLTYMLNLFGGIDLTDEDKEFENEPEYLWNYKVVN